MGKNLLRPQVQNNHLTTASGGRSQQGVGILKEAKPYVEDGVHPHSLIRSYRAAGNMVCNYQLSLNSLPTHSLQFSKAVYD